MFDAEFSAVDYTLNIVSKCCVFFIFKHHGLQTCPGKFLMGFLEKSWIFCQYPLKDGKLSEMVNLAILLVFRITYIDAVCRDMSQWQFSDTVIFDLLTSKSALPIYLCCLLVWVVFSCVFSCTVLFVSISQVIGCEDHLWNDLDCVGLGVKLCSTPSLTLCRSHQLYSGPHLFHGWIG